MQKNYDLYQSPFLLGQIYDNSLSQIDSYVAQEAIGFGQPVMIGDKSAKIPFDIAGNAEQPSVDMVETVKTYNATADGTCLGIA